MFKIILGLVQAAEKVFVFRMVGDGVLQLLQLLALVDQGLEDRQHLFPDRLLFVKVVLLGDVAKLDPLVDGKFPLAGFLAAGHDL